MKNFAEINRASTGAKKKINFFEKLWEHGRTLRRVGLVLVMCLITITQAYADLYLIGSMNSWNADNWDSKWRFVTNKLEVELDANTNYYIRIKDGYTDRYFNGGVSGTILDYNMDCTGESGYIYLTTAEAGVYTFHYQWTGSQHHISIYYPRARLKPGTILYFDATSSNTNKWRDAAFHAKYLYKNFDTGTNISSDAEQWSESPVETWVHYTTVPNNDYIGQVQICRMQPSDHSKEWNYSGNALARERSDDKQNCMIFKSAHAGYDNTQQFDWKTYCPPKATSSISDNGTVTYGGDGGSSTPYLVEKGGTIKVSASSTNIIEDTNMETRYQFYDASTSKQNGTGTTYDMTANASAGATHQMKVNSYNYYNSTSSTSNVSSILYYQTVNCYTLTYNANGGSGSVPAVSGTKYMTGTRVTVQGPNTLNKSGYNFVGWNTENDGTGTWYSEKASFDISANTILYAQWRDISETSCPAKAGGTVFSITMGDNSSGAQKKLTYGETVNLSSYGTITNGAAFLTDTRTANDPSGTKAIIEKSNPAKIALAGNNAMLALYLDCALAKDDKISIVVTDDNTDQLSITTTTTQATTPATSNDGDNYHKAYTIPSGSALIGKKVIYLWRSSSSHTRNVTSVTITRPDTRPSATKYTVGGGGTICSSGNASITLSNSQSGADYQLYNGASTVGATKAGTGSSLSWTGLSTAGTYTIKAVANANYLETAMTGSASISIYDAVSIDTDPTASVDASVDEAVELSGLALASGTFNSVAYQWQTCTDATPSSTTDITSDGDGAYADYYAASMTFTPASAGTYYFRCKVTDECGTTVYSDVVTVTATEACSEPTTSFADSYCNIGSTLDLRTLISSSQGDGTITYAVTDAGGTSASIADGYKFSATAVGTATVTATQAADATNGYCEKVMTADIVVDPQPSSSVNFEQMVLDNSKKYSYATALSAAHIAYSVGDNPLDSLDESKSSRNEPYLGIKLKPANSYIQVVVPRENTLKVKFGHISEAIKYSIDGVAQDDLATSTTTHEVAADASSSHTYKFLLATKDQTLVIKQIMIGEAIQSVTLPGKITTSSGGNGTITDPANNAVVNVGSTVNVTVNPDDGYELGTLTYTFNAATTDIKASKSFTMPNGNVTINATFVAAAPACTDPGLVFASATKTTTLCDAAPTNALTNTYGVAVTYTSTDETVATVASDGTLTIKKAGTTTITASSLEQTVSAVTYCADNASYTLTVNASTAAGLSYASTSVSKDANASDFTNELTNSHGLTVTYESSDPSVATVNASTGEVDVKAAGTTTITASSVQQKVSSTCYLAGEATYTLTVNAVYTVTYEYNGADGGLRPASAIGSSIELPSPEKDGYTLDGWYTTVGAKVNDGGETYSPTADITLYARWTETCSGGGGGSSTVTYDFEPVLPVTTDTYMDTYFTHSTESSTYHSYSVATTSGDISAGTNQGTYFLAGATGSTANKKATYKTKTSFSNIQSITFDEVSSDNSQPKYTVKIIEENSTSHTVLDAVTHQSILGKTGTNTWKDGYSIDVSENEYSGYVQFEVVTTSGSGKKYGLDNITINYGSGGSSSECNKVLYHGNGAKSGYIYDPEVYDDGDNPVVLGNIAANGVPFVKDGYTFQGWATSAGGSVAYSAGDEIENIDDDVHLYAVWAEAATTYTVTYANGGATGDVPVDASSPYEEDAPVTVLAKGSLAKTGYSFGGWSANVDLTIDEAVVTAGTPIAAGKKFAMPATNVTLTAVWNINSYDLTWALAGGTTTSAGTGIASGVSVNTTASVEYETTLSAPSVEKTGYTFSAWSPSVASTMPAANTTYMATWTKDTYTITYELHDEDAGSVSGKTSYQITDDDYDLPTPEWDGHAFLGWYATYSDGDYSDPVSVLTSGSTGNKTYHAKWADGVEIVWTITKVDSKLYKGGTGYSVKAVVNNTSWTGHDNLVLSASDGVTLGTPTKSTVDSKAQIVADFSISGSLADDAITFSLYAPATGVYAAIEDEEEVAIDACPSSGGSSTTLFSQNFNDATSIAYAAATEREYTTSTGTNNVVGNGDNLFTFIKTVQKKDCGIGQNNESGGNSRDYTKKFGAYYNNTNSGGIWAIVRNADFAATAPTALKMEFKLLVKYIAGGTPIEFAIGDGFSNAIAAPAFNKAYTGFGIYTSSASNIVPCQFGGTSTLTTVSSRKIDDNTEISYTWVINGTGETITYDAPNGEEKELADGKWDLWKGTVILINSQSRTASGSTAFSGAKMQELYIGNPQGKKGDITLDEIVITNLSSAGDGSDGIETSLAWSDDDAIAGTVKKNDNDGDFQIYASPTPANAGGTITYSSSNTSIATVSSDGTVHIINNGTTTITASMSAYGCYSPAEPITYSLVVANTCDDTPGTIVNNDGSAIAGNVVDRGACDELVLKLTGHSGSTIQWKKDGVNIPSANAATYDVPTGESGVYSATVTGICTLSSTNSITVTTAGVPEPTIFADDFYVKSGKWFGYRLMQINRGETVTVKTAPTGWTEDTDFSITTDASGIVSISGRKTISTPADKTLTLTIDNGCGSSVDKDITIREMAATAKPTIAWIATNNKGGSGQKDNVKADESTNTDLYDHLDDDYIITPRNCYWTTNEADLVKEYSQYDLIILTDYPNSGTCPSGKSGKSNSYTNAIGLLIDHKPIMTFEAFVAGCPNWGIASDPKNTQATQTDMTLLCNADEIFGTSGKFAAGEAITVTSASSGQALQGFPVASSPDFVFIGKITDNDLKTYVACCERQHEIAARMMVFGLNSSIMSSLTDDGKTMVKGFIEYLLKDDPASVPDCSVIFNGSGVDDSWYTTSNWEAGSLPDQYASVRIDAPCVVPANEDPAKAGRIKIHVTDMNSGSLTIEPEGRMIVEKTITRIEGNAYTIHMPTEPEDLIIQSDETAQGALIFDNESGTTQATVEMYSKGRYYDGVYNWQYVAVPLVSASRWNMGDWAYCFDNSIGDWTGNDVCSAFSAVGVTRMDAELPTYEFNGPLASTKNQTLTLYTSAAGNDGYNMIGNSWTAPIQIVNFQPGDFGTALYQVNIYNTGHDPEDGPAVEESTDQQGRWKTIPIAATQAAIDAGTWEDLKVIPSMQAFEVQNETGANTTLTLNYDRLVRTLPTEPNLNETKRAPRRTPVERTAVPQMRITLKDETTRENLYLFSGEQFSEGFDNGWDGVYNAGEAGYMQIYMLSPIGNLEISAQPEMEGTTFGFTAGSREVYTFSFKYVGNEELYFNDLKEKKSTLINDENEYTFTAQEGETGIRFMISATPYNSQQISTGMTNMDAEAPQAQKVIYNDKLFIIRGGKVFSADGHLVK